MQLTDGEIAQILVVYADDPDAALLRRIARTAYERGLADGREAVLAATHRVELPGEHAYSYLTDEQRVELVGSAR